MGWRHIFGGEVRVDRKQALSESDLIKRSFYAPYAINKGIITVHLEEVYHHYKVDPRYQKWCEGTSLEVMCEMIESKLSRGIRPNKPFILRSLLHMSSNSAIKKGHPK